MTSRQSTYVFLAFLLLFGQFSSLLHAMEHLQPPSVDADVDGALDSHGHPANHKHPLNFQHATSVVDAANSADSAESLTCLIYHLLGHMPVLLPSQNGQYKHYSAVCAVADDPIQPVVESARSWFSIRGPPASV